MPTLGSLRVLVVDDDVMNLRVAARLLRGLGHYGALAGNGHKALQLVEESAFDLVLMDINMPGLNGQDVLKTLRERGQQVRVLMMSGYVDDDTRRHFLACGADGLLVKPLSAEMLQQEMAS